MSGSGSLVQVTRASTEAQAYVESPTPRGSRWGNSADFSGDMEIRDDAAPKSGALVKLPSFSALRQSGIYFLYRDGCVVYVGKAVNVRRRICDHIADGTKDFDEISFIPCPPGTLDNWEARFIQTLMPQYNMVHVPTHLRGVRDETRAPKRPFVQAHFDHREAAEYLGVEPSVFADLVEQGVLRTIRHGPARVRSFWIIDLYEYANE